MHKSLCRLSMSVLSCPVGPNPHPCQVNTRLPTNAPRQYIRAKLVDHVGEWNLYDELAILTQIIVNTRLSTSAPGNLFEQNEWVLANATCVFKNDLSLQVLLR
jgi:hypothetical protein